MTITDPVQNDTALTADEQREQSLTTLQARCKMACDAVAGDKPFAADALRQSLLSLVTCLDEYELREPANGLLDVKVLEAIDLSEPALVQYRAVLGVIAQSETLANHIPALIDFLRQIIGYKNDLAADQQCVLWSDQYRFIVREIFLTTVAVLIREQRYQAVSELLAANYGGAEETLSFTVFDGYAKTLDEFRNRRLQLNRISVSSDLLRDRTDETQCGYNDLMQADFVLCLRSLVCEPSFFVRWYPRTLVYADQFVQAGFDLFVTGSDPRRFAPLAQLFEVADWAALLERFEGVYTAWGLDRWELGGAPLEFHGYMGLRNAALRATA